LIDKILLKEFDNLANKAKLNSLERVKKLWISKEKFTIESGLLTPTFKIK